MTHIGLWDDLCHLNRSKWFSMTWENAEEGLATETSSLAAVWLKLAYGGRMGRGRRGH